MTPLADIRPLSGPGTRTYQVTEALREAIFAGTLAPGDLLYEEAIAAQLAVSRTPVRDALKQLEMEGLARAAPNRGLIVADYSPEELEQLYMMREVLEGLASRLAASLRSETELAVLEGLVDEFAAALGRGNVRGLVAANQAFHESINSATRNAFLIRELTTLRRMIERLDTSTLVNEDRQRETLEEHRVIFAAITARDPEEAERATREHFRRAGKLRVLQAYSRQRAQRLAQVQAS